MKLAMIFLMCVCFSLMPASAEAVIEKDRSIELQNKSEKINSDERVDQGRDNSLDETLQGGEDCTDAVNLGSSFGSWSGSTIGAEDDYGSETGCWQGTRLLGSCTGPDVTYRWTAPFTGTFTFDLCGSDYNTGITLFMYMDNSTGGCPGEFICGNDNNLAGECWYQSMLKCIDLTLGDEVLVAVDGYGSEAGNYVLKIRECISVPGCEDAYFCGDPREVEPNDDCVNDGGNITTLGCNDVLYCYFCDSGGSGEVDFHRFLVPPLTRMVVKLFSGPECNEYPSFKIKMNPYDEDCLNISSSVYDSLVFSNSSESETSTYYVRVSEGISATAGNSTPYKIVTGCESIEAGCLCYGDSFSSSPGAAIPDTVGTGFCNQAGGITEVITVPSGVGTITDVNVDVNILHTYIGDLFITISHNGTLVNLKTRYGGGESCDNLITTWDDEGDTYVFNDCPHTGCILPYDPAGCGNTSLSAFDGTSAEGDWLLYVADGYTGDTGTLLSWGLCIETEPECEPEPLVIDLGSTPELPVCECLHICADTLTELRVGPLEEGKIPSAWSITAGCSPLNTACQEDCDPAEPVADEVWTYDPGYQQYYMVVNSTTEGCFCFCLDEILPVELLSFEAIPGDREVTLSWSTASENNSDRFEIMRNGTLVGRVTSNNSPGGGSYHWTDRNLSNGTEYTYSLIEVDLDGTRTELATVSAMPTFEAAEVTEYALHQNYPNPFNPSTQISFDIPEAGFVDLAVYNSLGQTMATLVNGEVPAGRHSVEFNAERLPSGLYFYRMEAGEFHSVRKMILMK